VPLLTETRLALDQDGNWTGKGGTRNACEMSIIVGVQRALGQCPFSIPSQISNTELVPRSDGHENNLRMASSEIVVRCRDF